MVASFKRNSIGFTEQQRSSTSLKMENLNKHE
ncbi:CLUMA_CG016360, isoform A [Clunio marinus]|uniref:CLUMA_CG016360, isoform A n=1 Tax=Clunio marinus TaxID=568069 RepID=A0A1J1ITG5_9DIPT|nr:CLUMA_CG016360, isoform A [Clunio marinus]